MMKWLTLLVSIKKYYYKVFNFKRKINWIISERYWVYAKL